ncbi:hypothetical protein [Desulfobacter postgatei]|uniref:Uncharacterized protein n=1 Tax=Desulfobacter postgatei 2ac9 TaxID=879212 RepID=I5B740_9BACT|nr:hypothetical protein [Desulfobacter postgatei]EIM65303.1 hypothetical protein DespoDRAFT_03547 [Desulfobacter postgatei 2ac9]
MDIIDLILSDYTDFIKFEDLANEIMLQEGYNNLVPAGGWHDEGVDAKLIKYYEQKEYNIIFQYSMQKETKSKITKTYEKIKGSGKSCDELIIVTLEKINNKEEVKKNFRKQFGAKPRIEIYDRQTFKSRLGANSTLLHRFFPNIKSQLESDLFKPTSCSDNLNSYYEKSLLKMTIAFSQRRQFFESNKRLFDCMVQSFVYLKSMCMIDDLTIEICKNLNAQIDKQRILASLNRLIGSGKVLNKEGRYTLIRDEIIKIEDTYKALESDKDALVEDVLYKTQNILKRTLSPASIRFAKRNIEESITEYFKLFAMEISISETEYIYNDLEYYENLINRLKRDLPPEEYEILIYAVGEVLKKPTDEQKVVLESWCKIYIGHQVLKLDPKQIKVQADQLQGKTFVLDTDFALNLLVSEVTKNSVYKRIVNKLIDYGAKVYIPTDVLHEVAKHAEFSVRSYKYFENKYKGLDPIIIEEQVMNVFVKGYFIAKSNGDISGSTSFDGYLKNYYSKNRPIDFLKVLVHDSISDQVGLIDLVDTELDKDEYAQLEQLQEKIYTLTIKTFKAEFRDDEENREIARIDARLYLNYLHKNKNHTNSMNSFKYGYYVLTTTTRPLKCAKELNILSEFYIKPLKMVSFLEKIEPFDLSYEEISNVFLNPFLAYSVSENWKYVEKLLNIGIDLKDANITRLKWELSELFEKDLLSDEIANDSSYDAGGRELKESSADEFVDLAREISNRGYKFVPSVKSLIDKYEEEREKNEKNTDKLAELEKEIDKFGKRKQKYLKRASGKIVL